MYFLIENNHENYEDLLQFFEFNFFEGVRKDVIGKNEGVNKLGGKIRDKITEKRTFQMLTRAIPNNIALHIESLVSREHFRVRTDYYGVSADTYTVFCDNIIKTFVFSKEGIDYVKLAGTFQEL